MRLMPWVFGLAAALGFVAWLAFEISGDAKADDVDPFGNPVVLDWHEANPVAAGIVVGAYALLVGSVVVIAVNSERRPA